MTARSPCTTSPTTTDLCTSFSSSCAAGCRTTYRAIGCGSGRAIAPAAINSPSDRMTSVFFGRAVADSAAESSHDPDQALRLELPDALLVEAEPLRVRARFLFLHIRPTCLECRRLACRI